MWKAYKYLFYKLYKLSAKISSIVKDDIPEYTAMFDIGVLVLINLASFAVIINSIGGFWHNLPDLSRGRFFVYLIPYFLFFYFTLVFNGKYKRIIKEFKNESEELRRKGRRKVIMYITGTLLLLIFSMVLIIMTN